MQNRSFFYGIATLGGIVVKRAYYLETNRNFLKIKSISTRYMPADTKPRDQVESRYRHYQISDHEGMVTLRDILIGSQELINVEHPKYDLPYEIGEVRNDVKYRVNAGETEERLLVVQKRESSNLT